MGSVYRGTFSVPSKPFERFFRARPVDRGGFRLLIDRLYYDGSCACCSGHFHNVAPSFTFSADVLQQYLRAIYNGFDTSRAVEPTMWREVLRVLNEATVSGLLQSSAPTHRDSFLAALRHSNEVFAAFKVHSMSERMAARLLNPDGTLKPFRQWADDVKSISSHYVGAWLRTEYDTALIRAHNAADWQQFIRDADVMPNLRWMPTTSPMPESSHRAFWERKLTLPVSDPFWDEHHPGDRWNCKCSLQQTDDPPTPELKAEFAGEAPQPGLTNNPGKDGHTFSQDHPYFPKSCASCGFYKKASIKNRLLPAFLNIRAKDCYDCPYINNCIPGKGKVEKQREAQQQAAAHIKAFRATLDPYRGTTLHNNDFVSGKLTILRRSMQDVFEHNREDLKLMAWLKDFDLEHIKGWKYKGWAENRPYDSSHPKFDPKNPNKRKHPETEYFLYYSLEIDGDTYWANVKMRKDYGEVLYTIEKKKPEDLILGLKR